MEATGATLLSLPSPSKQRKSGQDLCSHVQELQPRIHAHSQFSQKQWLEAPMLVEHF